MQPGLLYTTLPKLLEPGWVEETAAPPGNTDKRRRFYRLTPPGHAVLVAEAQRRVGQAQRVLETAHRLRNEQDQLKPFLATDLPWLRQELVAWVRKILGPVATPDALHWAPALPKTRSGKIMRRIFVAGSVRAWRWAVRSMYRRYVPWCALVPMRFVIAWSTSVFGA